MLIDCIFNNRERNGSTKIKYDVVVIDFNLSICEDGLTLCALLRNMSSSIRIVLASANPMNFDTYREEIDKLRLIKLKKPFIYNDFMKALGH